MRRWCGALVGLALLAASSLPEVVHAQQRRKEGRPADRSRQAAPPAQQQSGAGALGGLVGTLLGSQSDAEEVQVGEGIAATVLGAAKPFRDAKIQRYLNLVGRAISQQSGRKVLPWTFALLETSSVNAFAAPGGIVLLTTGLFDMLETEDELAAVLAHEIAHVSRQHHYNVIKQQKVVQFGAELALGQLGREKGLTGVIGQKLVAIGADLLARGLDKGAEYEADRDAMVLAARAGYDASALLTVLSKLAHREAGDPALALLFKSHPSAADRIERLAAITHPDLEAAAMPSPAALRIQAIGR